jgi:hypothetical protein
MQWGQHSYVSDESIDRFCKGTRMTAQKVVCEALDM